MVKTANKGGEPTQTIEAEAPLARVDGQAQSLGFEEIGVLGAGGEGLRGRRSLRESRRANAPVTGFAAFDQAQSAVV
jgi:hypothetical protein